MIGRRAKIAGTLGPSCDDEKTLTRIVAAGLDVARLNFSHGEFDDHRRRVSRLGRVARRAGKQIALMADLQGPRFRVGHFPEGSIDLVEGSEVDVIAGCTRAAPGCIPVVYAALTRDVKRNHGILFDDGKILLRVKRIRDKVARCTVERGGRLSDNKGINLPETEISVPTLTKKDRTDLEHAVSLGADWLAISFVRRAADIRNAQRLLARAGCEIPVMAKIERREAIDRLDEILAAADGVLVARGDLGVELPAERVPILQKQIIEAANTAGKPVMTATQMLDSMRDSPRPTRAEASDVANAVLDGSGCLLLTAETAVGSYPVEAVSMMAAIIEQAEAAGRSHLVASPEGRLSATMTTCRAGCRAAFDVAARYIVVFTQTGFSAQQTARFRPRTPILAFSPSQGIARRVNMYWGVEPWTLPALRTIEELMNALDEALLGERLAREGEIVVVLSGSPIGEPGNTNLMKVHRVGSARPGKRGAAGKRRGGRVARGAT